MKTYSSYFKTEFPDLIRYRFVTYPDNDSQDPHATMQNCTDYSFEIYKRPWLFGMLGSKRWQEAIQTNSMSMGMSFCKYLLKRQLKSASKKAKIA